MDIPKDYKIAIIAIISMGISESQNGGTVPQKAIFCGDIPLHLPYIGLIYGRYLQFRFEYSLVYFQIVRLCVYTYIYIHKQLFIYGYSKVCWLSPCSFMLSP